MLGKIVFFNPNKDVGDVEGEDGIIYPFSLIDCYDFEDSPKVGQMVEFGLEDGRLFFLKPSTAKEKMPVNIDSHDDIISPIDRKKTIPLEIHTPIPMEISIDEAIGSYFSKLIVNLEEYEYDFEEYEQLDYIKMRRFLTTAYHNLLELDSKFINNELVSFYEYVNEIYKLYKGFVRKLSVPKIAYEEIFLAAQPQYVWRKKKFENNCGEIMTQKGVVKNISVEMENIKKEFAKSPKNSSLESEVKRFNRMYVDSLHRMATLREENILLARELNLFKEKYLGAFIAEFTRFSRERKDQILRLLEGYAYYFDKKMWDCAESSKSIREFFRKADIQEDFSSKTYLKYYLKGLDDLKMSELHRELKTLLAYLESLSLVSMAIIDEDKEVRFRLLKIVRLNNADVKANAYERMKLFIQKFRKEPHHIVIIDTKIRNPGIEKSIEMIMEIQKKRQRKCRICLMSRSFSKEDLTIYRDLGVDNFIIKSLPENELAKRIDELLEGLHKDQLGD